MSPATRLLARAALLGVVGGLAGFAGGVAGVVYIAKAAEEAHRLAVRESARAMGLAAKLDAEQER